MLQSVYVLLALVLPAVVLAGNGLSPVLFTPGWGANSLIARVSSYDSIPACASLPAGVVPLHAWFGLFTSNQTIQNSYPDCFVQLMTLTYDAQTNVYSSLPGVEVRPGEPGGSELLINPDYVTFYESHLVTAWGYESGTDLMVVPYDWRLGSGPTTAHYYQRLKRFVEEFVNANGGRPLIWIAHSNGPPTVYAVFAQTPGVDQAWRDRYIAGFIPLSGNLGGQANNIETLVYDLYPGFSDNRTVDRELQAHWESTYWGGPFPPPFGSHTLVTTYAGTPQETNYTAAELPALLSASGQPDWGQMWSAAIAHGGMDRRTAPLVPTYCLYGLGSPTSFGFAFAGGILEAPYTNIYYVDGDDNQDYIDNTFCLSWTAQQKAAGLVFQSQAFQGVGHMDMVSDPNVMIAIHAALVALSPATTPTY